MVHRRGAARVLLCTLVVLALAGCGSAAPPAPPVQAPPATRTVVDMVGRTVTIPAEVTRVATGFAALNATMLVLGSADRLVATSSGVGPLFATLVPSYPGVPQPFDSGVTRVNEEELLAARPQVVLLFAGAQGLLPVFERLGIPAVVYVSFTTPEQIKEGVALTAEVLGGAAVERSRQFAAYYDDNVARVEARTATLPQDRIVDVYYTTGDPTRTEAKNSIVELWLRQAGARNLAAAAGIDTSPAVATVALEDVLGWDPDVVICRDAADRRAILDDPRWRNVTAVRDQRVHVNPAGVYVWSVRSAESALQPLWAAKTLHPDLFADVDMAAEVRRFYSAFYSYELSDAQVESILHPTTT